MKSAAMLTIKGPGRMTKRGRGSIAAWLRKQARHLERLGRDYTKGRFTARYFYR